MPLYEYQCPQCGRFELIQKFSDPPLTSCPTCSSAVQKLLSAPAIQFKGSGWYVTDYARKAPSEGGAKGEGAKAETAASNAGKGDTAKSAGSTAGTSSAGSGGTAAGGPSTK